QSRPWRPAVSPRRPPLLFRNRRPPSGDSRPVARSWPACLEAVCAMGAIREGRWRGPSRPESRRAPVTIAPGFAPALPIAANRRASYREVCAPLPAAPQPRRDSPECALAEKPASRDRTEHAVRTGRVPRYNHTKDLAAALPTHVAGCFSRLSFDQQYCQRTVNSFTIKGIVRHLGPNRNHRPVAVVLCLAMLATGVRSATASRQGTNGAHPAQVSRSF